MHAGSQLLPVIDGLLPSIFHLPRPVVGRNADDAEGALFNDAVIHWLFSFHGQGEHEARVERQLSLRAPSIVGRGTVHAPERPSERRRRVVAVAQGHVHHLRVRRPQILGCPSHSAATDVFGQRHARQIGEHPLQLILRAHRNARKHVHIDRAIQMFLDVGHGAIQIFKLAHFAPPYPIRVPIEPRPFLSVQVQLRHVRLVAPPSLSCGRCYFIASPSALLFWVSFTVVYCF